MGDFNQTFPLSQKNPREESVHSSMQENTMPQVLILAGDSIAIRSVQMSLQMEGYEPVRVGNGDELLSRFNAQTPAAVLCDLGTPWAGLQGLLRRLRAHGGGKKYRLLLLGERPAVTNDAALSPLYLTDADIFPHPVDMVALVKRLKETPQEVPAAKAAAASSAGKVTAAPPLAAFLGDIVLKKSTGLLEVEGSPCGLISFIFREGSLLGVQVPTGRLSIPDLMMARGRLNEAQRSSLSKQGAITFDLLAAQSLIASHEILEFGREQSREALRVSLADSKVTCRWHEGRLPGGQHFPTELGIFRAIFDAYKQHQGQALHPDIRELSPSLAPEDREKIAGLGLLPFELRLTKELNGRPLQSVVDSLANGNADKTRDITGFFNALHVLRFLGPPQASLEAPQAEGPIDWDVRKTQLEAELERMKSASPFDVLGIQEKTSTADAKTRFFALSKQYHPDRAFDAPPEVRKLMELIFQKVGEAYEVVSDPKKREEMASKKEQEEGIDARQLIQAEISFNQGALFLKNQNAAKARPFFEEAMKLNPHAVEHKVYYAWTLFQEDPSRFSEAAKLIHDVTKTAPNFDKGFYFLGCIFKARNEHTQAENAFKKAVGLNASNIEAQRELRLYQMRREKTAPEPAATKSKGLFGLFKK